jgi:hypothetical protein
MTVIRKYPTAVISNPGTWLNTTNMLGESEATPLCGRKVTAETSYQKCYLGTYGFAIPADAIISRITFGVKGFKHVLYNPSHCYILLSVVHPGYEWQKSVTSVLDACSDSVWETADIIPPSYLTIDDLNTENFQTYVGIQTDNATYSVYGWIDAIYIEVEYTVPAVGVPVGGVVQQAKLHDII